MPKNGRVLLASFGTTRSKSDDRLEAIMGAGEAGGAGESEDAPAKIPFLRVYTKM